MQLSPAYRSRLASKKLRALLYAGLLCAMMPLPGWAQAPKTCAPVTDKPYHPLEPGSRIKYQIVGGPTYQMLVDTKTVSLSGKSYLKQTIDYGTSQSVAYYRQEGAATVYRAKPEDAESTEIPVQPQKGQVWYEADSTWRYTIVSTAEELSTPVCRYTDCLHIQAEQLGPKAEGRVVRAVFQQYFQRGSGYVGTQMAGKLVTYRLD